ncbi:MAG: hypothetical protein COZ21_14865 [Bacteroidetes bacterium CG_4_10_14_3_um_filter_31_20]|nr:hypothetical protein [Bacteroidota bacterium]PIY02308.1 MAG: hypothetical protein COZ21_14865 [Bacteroidetes bacterium CG_4_10_14_3_um_filter_31_20]
MLSRRSIRKYIDKQITNKEVELLLKAGFYAPSANNYKLCLLLYGTSNLAKAGAFSLLC